MLSSPSREPEIELNGDRLRIALQKRGRLAAPAESLLKSVGLDFEQAEGRLFARCSDFPLDILLVRDDDIPEYVQDGVTDLGIVGYNMVLEKGVKVAQLDFLGFGHCSLAVAVPVQADLTSLQSLRGMRIATSYPRILQEFLGSRGLQARVVEVNGSVELAPSLRVADAICDLVSTGSTLRIHGLRVLETVLRSEALLVANPASLEDPAKAKLIERLRVRIQSQIRARRTKYVMMNAPQSALQTIQEILPGMKSPTVVPLAEPGMIAVHSAVPEDVFWDVIENLKLSGATDILVLPVEKMVS